jgi:regulator of sigma E protease
MLLILYTIALVILLLGASIFVHELGHFVVARWCGMVVDTFSIGFGHAIWKKKVGEVTYKIGWIPFGGYVALPQMDPTLDGKAEADTQQRALPPVAPWKRIVVSLAGATGNILFAIPLAWIVFLSGRPAAPHETNSLIGYVETNGAAYSAGARIGDQILAVNGSPVSNWNEISVLCATSSVADLRLRDLVGSEKQVQIVLTNGLLGMKQISDLLPQQYCTVAKTMPGSAAAAAEIRRGDRILECDGIRIFSRPQLTDIVSAREGRSVSLKLQRGADVIAMQITPLYNEKEKRALIGIIYTDWRFDVDLEKKTHPKPATQLREHATMIFRVLQALVTPGTAGKTAELIGGPLEIIVEYWLMIQSSFMLALWFTCFLNVNLAVVNLLPIPVFDGGHIVFALWEAVTRRPVHRKVANGLMNFFVILILCLAAFLTYRDVMRNFFPGSRAAAVAPTNQVPAVTNAVPQPGK